MVISGPSNRERRTVKRLLIITLRIRIDEPRSLRVTSGPGDTGK